MKIKEIELEEAKENLQKINNQLTLLMKLKKATQDFIKEETDRELGIKSIESKILDLYNDPEFIKINGRRRYYWEIGNMVGYSSRSIQRFFDNNKKTK